MYVSRLTFQTVPGKTHLVEEELKALRDMVRAAGGVNPRVLRTHYASLGTCDVVFEQEARDLAELENEIHKVTGDKKFQQWQSRVSSMLSHSPKREIYLLVE